MSGKIQNEDIKSASEIVTAGGTVAQLPNDDKIYVTGNSLDQTLKSAIDAGNLSRAVRTINAQTGTTYTFVLSDGSKSSTQPLITLDNASPITVTVPPNASVAFPIGTQIDCMQIGAGIVTFAPGSGVTINSKLGNLSISSQYVAVSLVKLDTNSWVLVGDLSA